MRTYTLALNSNKVIYEVKAVTLYEAMQKLVNEFYVQFEDIIIIRKQKGEK